MEFVSLTGLDIDKKMTELRDRGYGRMRLTSYLLGRGSHHVFSDGSHLVVTWLFNIAGVDSPPGKRFLTLP